MMDESVVAKEEVQRLCVQYEQALISNDVEQLNKFFWDSDQALRFGATEELYGAEEIAGFRQKRKINFADRTPIRQKVVTFGPTFAVATQEFSALLEGVRKHGRQTQVWVKIPKAGWRIVSAHVSYKLQSANTSELYVDSASSLLGIDLSTESAHRVAAELERMGRMVEPLLAFPLDDSVEPAPVFTP